MCNDYIMAIVGKNETSPSGSFALEESWNRKYERVIAPLEDRIGMTNTKLAVGGTLLAFGAGVGYLISSSLEGKRNDKNLQHLSNSYNNQLSWQRNEIERLQRLEFFRREGFKAQQQNPEYLNEESVAQQQNPYEYLNEESVAQQQNPYEYMIRNL